MRLNIYIETERYLQGQQLIEKNKYNIERKTCAEENTKEKQNY